MADHYKTRILEIGNIGCLYLRLKTNPVWYFSYSLKSHEQASKFWRPKRWDLCINMFSWSVRLEWRRSL